MTDDVRQLQQTFKGLFGVFSHLSFAVEAEDLEANAGGASGLDLVEMSEEVEPRPSPSIVQLTLCQNTQQSGLPRVHITQHGHPQVQELREKRHTQIALQQAANFKISELVVISG